MSLLALWQLASLSMLGWAAAAVAPILIHLLTRRRYRRVTWAAMEYLIAAVKKNQRRINLEQWLLLAVRTLLLVLFAIALTNPISSTIANLSLTGAILPTHHIFVIDGSYSMDLRRDGVSRFDAAKEAIRQFAASSQQGDGYSLLLIADPPQVVIGEPAFSKNDLLDELDALQLPHGLGELTATLTELDQIASSARKQHARLAATNIILLGDLEGTTWQPATVAAFRERIEKLGQSATLAFIDLGVEGSANSAVLSMEVRDGPVTVDREFTIGAEIAAYGSQSNAPKLATLLIDGETVAQQPIDLDSGNRGMVAFRHRFSSPGDHTAEIRLPDDALPIDNQRWLSIPVRTSLKALCIFGRPGESKFVAAALSPDGSMGARVVVEEATDSALVERELLDYDVVFLVNLPQLDDEQWTALAKFVQRGRGLVVFPGDQLDPAKFISADLQSQLLPAKFSSLSNLGEYPFAPLDYRHELIAPFRGFEKAGLLTTPVWKYVKLVPEKRDDVRTALAFANGDPAIVEGRYGQGRVILFATAASPASLDRSTEPPTPWSALATWPSFPPLVQESLALLARSREASKNRLVGDVLGSSLQNASAETQLTIVPPSPERTESAGRQVRLESMGDVWSWSYSETGQTGIYEARFSKPTDLVERYAVNLDPRESPLERIDPALLPASLTPSDPTATDASAIPVAASTQDTWYRPVLVAVLALLLVEGFLAQRFGGGRA